MERVRSADILHQVARRQALANIGNIQYLSIMLQNMRSGLHAPVCQWNIAGDNNIAGAAIGSYPLISFIRPCSNDSHRDKWIAGRSYSAIADQHHRNIEPCRHPFHFRFDRTRIRIDIDRRQLSKFLYWSQYPERG